MRYNTLTSYGSVSRFFHWTIALLVIANLTIGAAHGWFEPALRGQLMGLHKVFGIMVLALVAVRVVWWLGEVKPRLSNALPAALKPLVNAGHALMYAFLIVLPLSGWLFTSAAGSRINVFGWFQLPLIVEKNQAVRNAFHNLHETAGEIFIWIVALHVAAALVHHFIFKDNTLKRMLKG